MNKALDEAITDILKRNNKIEKLKKDKSALASLVLELKRKVGQLQRTLRKAKSTIGFKV